MQINFEIVQSPLAVAFVLMNLLIVLLRTNKNKINIRRNSLISRFAGKIFKDLVKKETESGEDEIKPKSRRKPTELDSDDDEETVDDVKPQKQVKE